MKYFPILLVLFFSSLSLYGQKKDNLRFDIKAFSEKQELASWLNQYDQVAWHTSDSVAAQPQRRKQLDGSWFCFQDQQQVWHALYGKYQQHAFVPEFHYTVINGMISETKQGIDTARCNAYARALRLVNREIKPLRDSTGVQFNPFVRLNPDKSISVWIFPAYQPDGTAVYGGEFAYKLNSAGNRIVERTHYFKGKFLGFKTDKPQDIRLNYRDLKEPTLGSIFFVIYYREYFTRIVIDNSESISTLFRGEKGDYSWVHTQKALTPGTKSGN
ncbi:hypothetical protein [Hymenobacter persicinus]|uniref:Uncharacterized protein n=1 Tax=Hymenobacter persicinus TaxID=2025506 RepID=A0A4Q5LCI2_9BACT|nr:hypothetical protein [Hymenobacter persicinus]RYU80742.1 hypothetical protein EWM57_07765 [Hymenobacter persicinus]